MKRKLDLLDRAHGLLCNAPGAGGAEHDHEEWLKLRAEWIDRWSHVIRDQQTKDHNRRIAVGNEAITDYRNRADVRVEADQDAAPAPVDDEHERRRVAVERAAGAVVAVWPAGKGATLANLHEAYDALREYAPREVAAPADEAPAPAPVVDEQLDELDRLAPRPWTTGDALMFDANGDRVVRFYSRSLSMKDDERLAELLVQVVNAARPAAVADAEQAVLAAAREWAKARFDDGPRGRAAAANLAGAVNALPTPGGAA